MAAASRLLPLLPVALLAILAWSRRWTSEDGFVLYRVVDNVLAGEGPVFNVGERVEAYSGPLWLALLALGRALSPDAVHLEWIGVGLGLTLSVAGLGCAVLGALQLWSPRSDGRSGRSVLAVPLGALIVAALPPFWDYATSGLETGLAFFWLGATFLGLVSMAVGREPGEGRGRDDASADRGARPEGAGERTEATFLDGLRSAPVLAVAVGLGPLVRTDLAPFALAFLILLVTLDRPRSLRRAAVLVGCAAAIPLLYQLFRMGYFASLVPNPALAGEAGAASWDRGWEYLVNFVSPYVLWLPLAVVVGWAGAAGGALWRRGQRDRAMLVAVPIATGLLHALFVVRLGGDHLHARMLLPSVFALLMPVAVVSTARRRSAVVLALLVLPWAIVCATALRAPARPPADPRVLQVYDERRQYADLWGYRHPVTLDGYLAVPERRPAIQRRQGLELARLAERRRAIVLSFTGERNDVGERLRIPQPLSRVVPRAKVPSEVVAWHGSIGRVGFAAGPNVRLVDANGVADALAARIRLPRGRLSRPGREKHLPREWVLARYASAVTPAGAAWLERDPGIVAARRALGCEPLRELIAATSGKLGVGRFLTNVEYSIRARSLRFSRDPRRAARELCRGR